MSKHRTLSGLTLLILLLTGCAGNDGTGKPDDLIPADKMADILTEIHLAEAQVGRYSLRSSDSSTMVFNRLNDQIFKKFDVDTSAYRTSYIYYSSHPDLFEAIYKDVTGELEKLTSVQSDSAISSSATSGSATSTSASTTSGTSGSLTSGSGISGTALSVSTTPGSATLSSLPLSTSSTRAFLRRKKR